MQASLLTTHWALRASALALCLRFVDDPQQAECVAAKIARQHLAALARKGNRS